MTTVEIRLGDEDRARLGCPEWMPLDLHSVTAREAMILQAGVDLGDGLIVQFDTPANWRRELTGRREQGTAPRDWLAELVLVWLALRRAGVQVPLRDLEYNVDVRQWRTEQDEQPDAEQADTGQAGPGKDPSTPEPTSDGD